MAKKSVKKETKQKKSTPNKTSKSKQTTLEENEKKGKLTVSQRERDEIDAVVDTLWSFVNALKNAWKNSRAILLAGIIIGLLGISFSDSRLVNQCMVVEQLRARSPAV